MVGIGVGLVAGCGVGAGGCADDLTAGEEFGGAGGFGEELGGAGGFGEEFGDGDGLGFFDETGPAHLGGAILSSDA